MTAQPVGARKVVLIASLTVLLFVLLAVYSAVLAVFLPNQIELLAGSGKTGALAIVFAITSVFSTLATPIAGAVSDRTRGRWGRRTPWIVIGGLVGAGSLAVVAFQTGLAGIVAAWVVGVVTLNTMQVAATTVVADRLAPAERGLASGFIGAGMTAGGTVGVVFGGLMASHLVLGYTILAGAIGAMSVLFVALNPDPRPALAPPDRFDIRAFLAGFWVDPRQHPDFAWAFMGRFMIYMGYQAIVTYLLYILQDYIGLSREHANLTIARLSAVTFVALVAASLVAGWVSDLTGRRKPPVFVASLIMAMAVAVPLIAPTEHAMVIYAVLIGLGYGAFMSVDLALMTQVLPETGGASTARDLGLLTTAINIPQILSPVFAAWLLSIDGHDYRWLFVASALFVTAGAFFVLPIRSVK